MRSACNRGIVLQSLQMLHAHILFVAPYLHLDFNNKDDYNVINEFVSSNMLHLHGFEWLYTLESVFFEQRLATANIALKQ